MASNELQLAEVPGAGIKNPTVPFDPKDPTGAFVRALMLRANAPRSPKRKRTPDSDDSSSSDEEDVVPPGPIEPERCLAHGPGFHGGAAGAQLKLTVVAKDAAGKRIKEGGAQVSVGLEPAGGGERTEAKVTDHGNGNYTAVYSVPTKGNYKARQMGGAGLACAAPRRGVQGPAARSILCIRPACLIPCPPPSSPAALYQHQWPVHGRLPLPTLLLSPRS